MATISPNQWLDHSLAFDKSYEFISNGGSLIRFVTVSDALTHLVLDEKIDEVINKHSMWYFGANSKDSPFTKPQTIVNWLSHDIPVSIEEVLTNLCKSIWKTLGVTNNEIYRSRDASFHLDQDVDYLQRLFMQALNVFLGRSKTQNDFAIRDESSLTRTFTRDFSNAVRILCLDLTLGNSNLIGIFDQWLRGEKVNQKDLKSLRIMSSIKQDNASATLRSLIALCTGSDSSTCVLHLDIRAVTDPGLFSEFHGLPRSTRPVRVGTYQWLRELIDQTSLFRNTMIIVETGPEFVNISPSGYGVGIYEALKNRIVDDVSVINQVNASAVSVALQDR
jgi:hypothetical protein